MLKLPAMINIEVAICILEIFISPFFTDSTKNANTHKTYPDQEFPLAVLGKPYFYTSSQPSFVRNGFSRMQSR